MICAHAFQSPAPATRTRYLSNSTRQRPIHCFELSHQAANMFARQAFRPATALKNVSILPARPLAPPAVVYARQSIANDIRVLAVSPQIRDRGA